MSQFSFFNPCSFVFLLYQQLEYFMPQGLPFGMLVEMISLGEKEFSSTLQSSSSWSENQMMRDRLTVEKKPKFYYVHIWRTNNKTETPRNDQGMQLLYILDEEIIKLWGTYKTQKTYVEEHLAWGSSLVKSNKIYVCSPLGSKFAISRDKDVSFPPEAERASSTGEIYFHWRFGDRGWPDLGSTIYWVLCGFIIYILLFHDKNLIYWNWQKNK